MRANDWTNWETFSPFLASSPRVMYVPSRTEQTMVSPFPALSCVAKDRRRGCVTWSSEFSLHNTSSWGLKTQKYKRVAANNWRTIKVIFLNEWQPVCRQLSFFRGQDDKKCNDCQWQWGCSLTVWDLKYQIQENNCAEVKVMSYCSTFVQQPRSEYSVD